jgi:hypothetical protein
MQIILPAQQNVPTVQNFIGQTAKNNVQQLVYHKLLYDTLNVLEE